MDNDDAEYPHQRPSSNLMPSNKGDTSFLAAPSDRQATLDLWDSSEPPTSGAPSSAGSPREGVALLRPSLERLERARNSVGALPARRASLAVPDPDVVRRKQDEAILASLSGDMSAVNGEGSSVMVASVFKETLSQVQKVGTFFHGFGDDEIDTIFPFLTHFPFQDGDLLAQKGEQASWVGVLLTGQLDAKTDDGKVLGQLKPGFIVGEMALFRGGTRFCDLVGNGAGALAALLFADIPRMFDTAPTLAYRLVVAFGKAAAAKFVLPHPPPSGQPTKPPPGGRTGRRNSVATESAVQRRALTEALGRRGLASKEVAQLLGVLIVSEFGPGAVLMQEGRELRHVGIVMEGTVIEGEATRGVGELVGAWFALSGYPVHHKVVGGPEGGSVGYLTLSAVADVSVTSGDLAFKMLKLIGIGATASKESGSADASTTVVADSLTGARAEVLFRNKMKTVEAKAKLNTEEMNKALHDKERNAMLMKKLQRAHEALQLRVGSLEAEVGKRDEELSKKERQIVQKDSRIKQLRDSIDEKDKQLDMAHDGTMQLAAVRRLTDEVEAQAKQLSELKGTLEAEKREADEAVAAYDNEYRALQDRSKSLYLSLQARFRWRMAILLVMLDAKRRVERKARCRAFIVEWLSGEEASKSDQQLSALRLEIQSSRHALRQASEESVLLRDSATTIASQKAVLEGQQAGLRRATQEALEHDEMLDAALKASEEKAEALRRKSEEQGEQLRHLKWALSEADANSREMAGEAAELVSERDRVLHALKDAKKVARAAAEHAYEAERALVGEQAERLAERSEWAALLGRAEGATREAHEARWRATQLQEELDAARIHQQAEGVSRQKQRLLLRRISELESTFGPVLHPSGSQAAQYTTALKELVRTEQRLAGLLGEKASAAGLATMIADHHTASPPPAKKGGGSGATMTSVPALTAAPHGGRIAGALAGGSVAGGSRGPALRAQSVLPTSVSLPQLRSGPSTVARGAARVALRRAKGVSVGSGEVVQTVVGGLH